MNPIRSQLDLRAWVRAAASCSGTNPRMRGRADGLLIIEARRERVANTGYEAGAGNWQRSREFAEYSSASVTTRGLHSWRYGRFEMRGRIDTRAGLWPAFWTLGIAGDWPHNGEIDIMEYDRGILLANVAWGGASASRRLAAPRKPLAASRPLTGPTAFMSGAWTGTSSAIDLSWTATAE